MRLVCECSQYMWSPQINTSTKVRVSQGFLCQQAVTDLKSTKIWKMRKAVWNWLNSTWLYILLWFLVCHCCHHSTGHEHAVILTPRHCQQKQWLINFWSTGTAHRGTQSLLAIKWLVVWEFIADIHGNSLFSNSHICPTTITHTKALCLSTCVIGY